jgi:hypothetical protein
MIPIAERTVIADPHEPLAWYLAYRYVGDRSTMEAIAEHMGLSIDRPDMPDEAGEADPLAVSAEWVNEHDVRPALDEGFAKSRAAEVSILIRCMDRVRRLGPQVERADLAELGALLRRRFRTALAGDAALESAIRARHLDEEALVRFLARRTYRREWLYAPVAALYPNRRWSALR